MVFLPGRILTKKIPSSRESIDTQPCHKMSSGHSHESGNLD